MKESEKSIYVTKPYLPPLEEFLPYLKQIWRSKILTNNGPFLKQFEKELADYLDVPYVTVVVNGTSALEISIKYLGLKGEVITTPYSFVATSQALIWNSVEPVFVDIEPDSCNIDPGKIEQSITKNTTAILPVHVYGYPCKIEQIQDIADKYKIKTIYDAAHAFGVKYKGKSIASYGDLSILSFHATKVINTFEGGAVICHDPDTKRQLDAYRDFGFYNETGVTQPGINAKMNEFQAALGILQLKHLSGVSKRLKEIFTLYLEKLSLIPGVTTFLPDSDTEWNYLYLPVFINEKIYGLSRDELFYRLKENNIFCRRYFYPLISSLNIFRNEAIYKNGLPVASHKSDEVLCLPIYPDFTEEDINRVIKLLTNKL